MTAVDGITIKGAASNITVGFIDKKDKGVQLSKVYKEGNRKGHRITYRLYYNGNVSVAVCTPKCAPLLEAKIFPLKLRVKAEKLCYAAAEKAIERAQGQAKKIRALTKKSVKNVNYDPKQEFFKLIKNMLETRMVLDYCDIIHEIREIYTNKPQTPTLKI
jgi:hypothetical protein